MSETEERIRHLIRKGEVRISVHGYEELSADGLYVGELLDGIERARLVEDYPEYPKGPCILVLQEDLLQEEVFLLTKFFWRVVGLLLFLVLEQ